MVRPSWLLRRCSSLDSADGGGVGYCASALFASGRGVLVRDDASLCSCVGHDVCPNGPGILDGDPARLQFGASAGCGMRARAIETLLWGVATSGDGTRRTILAVSLDAARLEVIREDRRGMGSIDLRC